MWSKKENGRVQKRVEIKDGLLPPVSASVTTPDLGVFGRSLET